jgi:hypothetical protein
MVVCGMLQITPTGATYMAKVSFDDFTNYLPTFEQNRLFSYSDWRILKITAMMVPIGDFAGCSFMSFQEADPASDADVQYMNSYTVTNTNRDATKRLITWRSASTEDLSFKPVDLTLDPVPVYLCIYSLNGDWSGSEVAYRISIKVHIQTRGISDFNSITASTLRKVFKNSQEKKEYIARIKKRMQVEQSNNSGSQPLYQGRD